MGTCLVADPEDEAKKVKAGSDRMSRLQVAIFPAALLLHETHAFAFRKQAEHVTRLHQSCGKHPSCHLRCGSVPEHLSLTHKLHP